MKLSHILSIIFLTGCIACANGQGKSVENIHARAHKMQLANAKSRLDKSVIQGFLKNDIERREQEPVSMVALSNESAQMVKDLLKEAKTHIGKQYRSGGKGPYAFDCSGFASYVYRQFGYSLSASSSSQYSENGVDVKKNDLKPGDLVFFKGRNRNGGVGHVGIVVTADNENGLFKFIHASTSQGVRIDGNDGYYATRYIGAKRIITE